MNKAMKIAYGLDNEWAGVNYVDGAEYWQDLNKNRPTTFSRGERC